jgi:antitoxin (DNA-binding transcriptional repressor) of toxin-antitoxin stability system
MKPIHIISVEELKANFSEVLKRAQLGEEIGIAYGKNKVIVARLVPKNAEKKMKREIGILDGKAKAKFSKDFKSSASDFPNSIKETLHLNSTTTNRKRLDKAVKNMNAG